MPQQESLADEIDRLITEYTRRRNPGANVESLKLDWRERIIVDAVERHNKTRNGHIESEADRLQKIVQQDEA